MVRKLLLVIALIIVLTVTACQPAGGAQNVQDTELNVLCTPQEEWCQGMKQEFEAKYGITVNYVKTIDNYNKLVAMVRDGE